MVVVADDGRGLPPAIALGEEESTGSGLGNMRERSKALGGTCAIINAPGARLTLRFPVRGA